MHDQDRPLRAGGDVCGDASGHPAAEPGPAVGAEDDEAGVVIVGDVGDRLAGGQAAAVPPGAQFPARGQDLGPAAAVDGAVDPAPAELEPTSASYVVELKPGESRPIFLGIECDRSANHQSVPFLRGLRAARRELKHGTRQAATVETSNEIFNEVLCRSMADLWMLMTDTSEGRFPYAGIPWYSTTFGRDSLITAMQMLWFDPSIARGVLRRLAAYQAKIVDPSADAQPGKILHEMRNGEMARLRETPFGLYYGSVDSTPLFVLLAGLYGERTGDDKTLSELWPSLEAALRWIDGPGDPDQDGFVEYERAAERGLANQGWKDSDDAIFHADGGLADGSIALAEVQGYVFAAKRAAARCARRIGHLEQARKLEAAAERLAEQFAASFWCPTLETYALALDGAKNPCRVRTSNAGQVLFTGIAPPDHAAKIAEGLLRPPSSRCWPGSPPKLQFWMSVRAWVGPRAFWLRPMAARLPASTSASHSWTPRAI